MGIGAWARKAWSLFTVANATAPYRGEFAWAPDDYMPIDDMWQAMFGGADGPISRDAMMTIPVVLKARNTICDAATLPLVEIDSTNRTVANALLLQFDPDIPNVVHLSQTLEDLFADGIAWWEVLGTDRDGRPVKVRRRDPMSVTLQPPNTLRMPAPLPGGYDPRGAVLYVDGRQVPKARMVRFDSPRRPARVVCAEAIRTARAYARAAERYANDPRPLDYFTTRLDGQPDPDGPTVVTPFLKRWKRYIQAGITGYLPAWAKYEQVENPTPADLQINELSEFVAKQLAIALGLRPEDAGVNTTSRVYQNDVDRRQDTINTVMAAYMQAVTDRLSMPDITRRGNVTVFRLDEFLRSNPTERWQMYETAARIGAMSVDFIMQIEGLPPEAKGTPAAAPAPAAGSQSNVRALPRRAAAADDQTSAHTFDDTAGQFADLTVTQFAVDRERRTIRGRALPYGRQQIATKFWRKYRFEAGSIEVPAAVSRVKFLEDHVYSAAFGRAETITDGPDGLDIVMRVGRGEHGDRMLSLAEDGVKDGLSVGVDWDDQDTIPDPDNKGVTLIRRARLKEVSLVAIPAFDNARVTSVAASADQERTRTVECSTCGQVHAPGVACPTGGGTATATLPAPGVNLTADQFTTLLQQLAGQRPDGTEGAAPPADVAALDLPGHLQAAAAAASTTAEHARITREPMPYTFGWNNEGQMIFTAESRDIESGRAFDLSRDLYLMQRAADLELSAVRTDAGRRVASWLHAQFAVVTTDVNELNPTINRQDMYVDQRDYRYPLWNAIAKGAPPNGVQPFAFPKFSSASGLVGDHTEGVEPTPGTYVTTSQTVQPSALSGAADITRETWDMGGNPAVSTLIWNQMQRSWREGLENATATFLNTLTAAADVTLTAGGTDTQVQSDWDDAVIDSNFIRAYDLSFFGIEKNLYKKFAKMKVASGSLEPVYPMINPTNRNGTAAARFRLLDLDGVTGTPAWALPATAGSANNSWWFDPTVIYGWATQPTRLEFAGHDADGEYAPIAMIKIGIWGYKAFACVDTAGVRQVIYDTTA